MFEILFSVAKNKTMLMGILCRQNLKKKEDIYALLKKIVKLNIYRHDVNAKRDQIKIIPAQLNQFLIIRAK